MKHLLIGIVCVCIGLQWLAAEDESHPLREYEASLEVRLPYATILPTETFPVSFKLINKGSEPIRVITEGLNDGLQLVWVPWRDGKPEKRSGGLFTGMYRESPLETFRDTNLDIHETKQIGPGETFEADRVLIGTLSWNLPEGRSETEFRPAFYGGKRKVIYGSPFKIKFVPKPLKSFRKVFETTFTAGGTLKIPLEIYEVPIENERYLFDGTGMRFCRIPPRVNYTISMRQEGRERIMTVKFDDPSLKPLVFSWRQYQLVSASQETVPWLFGKAAERASTSRSLESRDGPVSGGNESGTKQQPRSTYGRHGWYWITGVCLIIGILIVSILIKSKRSG